MLVIDERNMITSQYIHSRLSSNALTAGRSLTSVAGNFGLRCRDINADAAVSGHVSGHVSENRY